MLEVADHGAVRLVNRHQMASKEEAKLAKKLARKRKHKELQQASERFAAEEPAISKKQKRDKKKASSSASEAAEASAALNRLSAGVDKLDKGSNGQTMRMTDSPTVSTVPKKKKQRQDQRLQNGNKKMSTSQSMEEEQPLPKKLKTRKKRAQEVQMANGSAPPPDSQVRHSMIPSFAAKLSESLPDSLPWQQQSSQTIPVL